MARLSHSSRFSGRERRYWRSRRLLQVTMFAVALLTCGCNDLEKCEYIRNGFKVGPNYVPPSAPVASEWIDGKDPRIQASPPRDANWWDVFQDPHLNSLICQAYRQNPNLRAVAARVLQSRAQRGIAIGNLFPQKQQAMGLYDFGNTFNNPFSVALTTFNLSWEIDFWGKYRRQVESANDTVDASVAAYDDALVTLLADVATNYVQFRVAQLRIKIARENLKNQERLLNLSEQQQRVGTATTLDVEQFRTLYEQTRASIPVQQIAQGQANDALCTLTGIPPHDLEQELGSGPDLNSFPVPRLPNSVAAGVPAELLSRRPDIREAERQVAAQNAQIGVAKAGYLPSISVGTMLGYADLGLPPLPAEQGFLIAFTPSFQWNILNYGRIRNNVRLQQAHTDELTATYQYRVLNAAQEVQTALRGFLLSQDQATHLSRAAAAAAKSTQIEERLFIDIRADVNRLFTLESSLLSAQDALALAQGNIALNLISAYRALGGGWEIRTRENETCGTANCKPAPPPATPVDPAIAGFPTSANPTALPQPRPIPPPQMGKIGN